MLRSVVVLLIGAFVLAGCRVGAPPAAPPEEFGDFAVGLFGGVAGLQMVLRVRADGVAVLASREPASGQVGPDDLARLRTLLTSEQFRREAAATAGQPPGSNRCSDLFVREVTMGSLTVRKSDRCGDEERPDTPAFDEIQSLLADELDGRFAAPVGDGAPVAVPLRLSRAPQAGTPGFTIDVDAEGQASRRGLTGAIERRTLDAEDNVTLQLLAAIVREATPRTCTKDGAYRLTLRTTPPFTGTDCTLRSPQFFAIVGLLANAFD